jgi:ketosteroid isomerase-like protein
MNAPNATLAIAQAAFADYANGLATGQWDAFLARLSDDFTFWFPAGPFQGQNIGKERMASFVAMLPNVFPEGLQLTVLRVTHNDTTVVFEVRSEGAMGTHPYVNQAAIAFDIQGDRVCSYREYLGVVFQLSTSR